MHFECFHPENSCLHLQQKWHIILFIFLKLPAGIGDNVEISCLINLRQNGSQLSSSIFVTKRGICYQGILTM